MNEEASRRRERITSLSMVVSSESPFCEAVSQLCPTELKLYQDCDTSCFSIENGILVIGPELFERDSLELGLPERIFQLCGQSVKVVRLFRNSNCLPQKLTGDGGVVRKFVTLVKMYCPNVENLGFKSRDFEGNPQLFDDNIPALLEQFSSQLRSIEWKTDVKDKHCNYFPDISVCTNIRKLDFPASSQLITFLRSFGASLESLTISYNDIDGYAELIDVIERNCPNLASLLLSGSSSVIQIVGEERYANVLCSIGSQLTRAEIKGLSVKKLARVVRACPNLLIPSQHVHEGEVDDWDRVGLLGPKIKRLVVASSMCCDEKCGESIRKCTNLQELKINRHYGRRGILSDSELTFLSSLLSSSLVSFCDYSYYSATQQHIRILSSGLRNLNTLILGFIKPIESGIDFNAIALSNPRLNSVAVFESKVFGEKRKKGQSMEIARMLINAFSKCRCIHFRLIHYEKEDVTRDEIHDLCGSLPCRGVRIRIEIGSTCYRQTGRFC